MVDVKRSSAACEGLLKGLAGLALGALTWLDQSMGVESPAFAQHELRAPDGAGRMRLTGWQLRRAREHRGLPGTSINLVISLSGAVTVAVGPSATARGSALVAGMHTSPIRIHEQGPSHGLQLKLSPRAVRRCLGPAARELMGCITDLEALVGRPGRELQEQLQERDSWPRRFNALQAFIQRQATHPPLRPELDLAFERFTSPSPASVAALAREVGWSRRHLAGQFRAEFGLPPTTLRRLARFERARIALQRGEALATAALGAGYYDQAHLNHEWSRLAGCTPTQWLAERFPSVQDGPA